MAETYKRLGAMSGTTVTAIATNSATAGNYTIISSIIICNAGTTAAKYTISTSATTAHESGGYIAYECPIAANDTVILTIGLCLDSTVKYLNANGSVAAINISAFGLQGP